MSIIDWWYTSFNDGRNISTKDIEEIKDEYPAAYELLKVQNVKSLAVSPFRYKDEIYGFFGVDNPPESEMDEISRFLDMIGTFLVLLLKQRNVFKNPSVRLCSAHIQHLPEYICQCILSI